jgi:hypothetical protein
MLSLASPRRPSASQTIIWFKSAAALNVRCRATQLILVTSPTQFDEHQAQPTPVPDHEHTKTALLDLGLSWEEVMALKEHGAIG